MKLDYIKRDLLIDINKREKEIEFLKRGIRYGTPHNNDFTPALNYLSNTCIELENLKIRLYKIIDNK